MASYSNRVDSQHETAHSEHVSSIRYFSTVQLVDRHHHTLSQYRTAHSERYQIAHSERVGSYLHYRLNQRLRVHSLRVVLLHWQHTLAQYRTQPSKRVAPP
eukprot:3287491-Rhodomonas_salina.2